MSDLARVFSKTYPLTKPGIVNRYADIERLLNEWRVELHLLAVTEPPTRRMVIKLEVAEAE